MTAGGTSSVAATRRAAGHEFGIAGYPSRRDEYWKYTDPALLKPGAASVEDASWEAPADLCASIPCLRISFLDGVLSDFESPGNGVELAELGTASEISDHWVHEAYGKLEERGRSPISRPFATLNTSRSATGLAIRSQGPSDRPVALTYERKQEDSDVMLRHVVKLEEGADLTLVELGPAAARLNKVIEVEVADGASFRHLQIQGRSASQCAATHIFARLGRESVFKSFTMSGDCGMTRNESIIELAGEGGVAHLSGASFGSRAFHHDDTVFIRHAAAGCESRQVFKKVLPAGAVGVFQGKILVEESAQKTDGYQLSQGLLLDDTSQFLAKPELEIYADDVVCSHGSTCGSLDEEALFYLRSRGVPADEARDMLALSFLLEPILEIDDPRFVDALSDQLRIWLAQRLRCRS